MGVSQKQVFKKTQSTAWARRGFRVAHLRRVLHIALTAIVLCSVACKETTKETTPAPRDESARILRTTAADGYIYGYPLVLMDATRAKLTNLPHPLPAGLAPINQFGHMKAFPDSTFTDVVSPNADTLYSSAWLDLDRAPIVLSLPDTHGLYYLMPMLDGWTNVFASPGKRTTGTEKGSFAITGPHWAGSLPVGLKGIKSPTDMVWIIGRTQANGEADFSAVNALQAQYKLTPLSQWGMRYVPPSDVRADPNVDMNTPPVERVASMDAMTFFSGLALLMKNNPPAVADAPMAAKLASMGVIAGQPFDLNKKGTDAARAIVDGLEDGKKRIVELGHAPGNATLKNGWMVTLKDIGTYGTNYDAGAGIARVGLGANIPQDAVYPLARVDCDGNSLNGANKYMIHFDQGKTPPVNAFWSVTMFNEKQAFVTNPMGQHAIGDRDALKFNPDGSLDLYLQHDSPGKDKESNWLPAAAGSFNVMMRMYWPKEPVLSGVWAPPPIKKVG
jgi:hypothetical protein